MLRSQLMKRHLLKSSAALTLTHGQIPGHFPLRSVTG